MKVILTFLMLIYEDAIAIYLGLTTFVVDGGKVVSWPFNSNNCSCWR